MSDKIKEAFEKWFAQQQELPFHHDTFKAGYEAAQPKWLDIEHQKPTDGEQCWVHLEFPSGEVAQGYAIWDDNDWWLDLDENRDLLSRKKIMEREGFDPLMGVAKVKLWQHLPQPPEEG